MTETFSNAGPNEHAGVGVGLDFVELQADGLAKGFAETRALRFVVGKSVVKLPSGEIEDLDIHTSKPNA